MRWAATVARESFDEDRAAVLPVPWTSLGEIIKPKGGSCLVVIAAPGVGKTTMLLNWAARSGVRTLYVSSDTSPQDVTAQLSALATGHLRPEIEARLLASPTWRREYARAVLDRYPRLVLDFTPRPSMAELMGSSYALTELWGSTPQLIVIDTASNIAISNPDSYGDWEKMWLGAKLLARNFNAVVALAHHVKQGPARSGSIAPEQSDGLWGSDKYPEIVLGLHRSGQQEVTVTVRKNRSGPRDVPVKLDTDMRRAAITDEQEETW